MRSSVRKPAGTLITTPDDGKRESQLDTIQCVHCGRHWVYQRAILEAINGELGFCGRCNGITCGELCQECVPLEQQLENMEALLPEHMIRTHRPVVVGGFLGADKIRG